MKAFLVFRWALAALPVLNPGSLGEDVYQLPSRHRSKETHRPREDLPRVSVLEFEAGSEARIPCNLKKRLKIWYWIPQYPTCAGVKGGPGEKRIFSSGTGTETLVFLERFQGRLTMKNEKKGTMNDSFPFFLRIQTTYMNDSGTFFCSNDKKNSTLVLVTVKPGYQNGITAKPNKESVQNGQEVMLSCNNCEDQNNGNATGNDTITWTLNGNPFHSGLTTNGLSNKIIIQSFSSRYYGIWNCNRPMCPGKFKGYCLESDFRFSRGAWKETTSLSTPISSSPPNAENPVDARLIGFCVAVFLGVLLVGAGIFFTCRRCRSHSVSETTRLSDLQDSKNPTGPPMKREEEPIPDDHIPKEAEAIQYSTLTFRDPGGHQIKIDNETSVIYSNITAARS